MSDGGNQVANRHRPEMADGIEKSIGVYRAIAPGQAVGDLREECLVGKWKVRGPFQILDMTGPNLSVPEDDRERSPARDHRVRGFFRDDPPEIGGDFWARDGFIRVA